MSLFASLTHNTAHWLTNKASLAAGLTISLILSLHYTVTDFEQPKKDALRYVDYAYVLANYHTFGLSCGEIGSQPCPSNANAPLYPALLALAALGDQQLLASFSCLIKANGIRPDCVIGTDIKADTPDPAAEQCPRNYQTIIATQYLIAGLSLWVIWLLANKILASPSQAWLALLAALLSGILTKYAGRLLTENLLLLLFLLLQYNLISLWHKQTFIKCGLTGLLLGLLTLTRPEYLYIATVLFGIALTIAGVVKSRVLASQGLVACIIFICVLAPWSARNIEHFNSPTLTGGNYGEIILSQRVVLNQMDLREWLGAFVYWIPDFGDSLAKRVLPESWYGRHLRTHPDSFRKRSDIMIAQAVKPAESSGMEYLLREEVLAHPIKHLMVTIPLTWRGVFIAKYWGIIGALAYLALLIRCIRNRDWLLVVASVPAWLVVIFHAAISVNVPRYNLVLIGLYALAWASILSPIYDQLTERLSLHRKVMRDRA